VCSASRAARRKRERIAPEKIFKKLKKKKTNFIFFPSLKKAGIQILLFAPLGERERKKGKKGKEKEKEKKAIRL